MARSIVRRKAKPSSNLADPASGRVLEIRTDQPGIQLYTGNYLDGTLVGHGGKPYAFRSGLCLETQVTQTAQPPGEEGWKSCVLRPGETYRHLTVHKFKWIDYFEIFSPKASYSWFCDVCLTFKAPD